MLYGIVVRKCACPSQSLLHQVASPNSSFELVPKSSQSAKISRRQEMLQAKVIHKAIASSKPTLNEFNRKGINYELNLCKN
jgi:hypothetical protein